jgi:hypothetical protein
MKTIKFLPHNQVLLKYNLYNNSILDKIDYVKKYKVYYTIKNNNYG